MSMITVTSPTGQTIHTDSQTRIQEILESEGINWIDALHEPVLVSKHSFDEIDALISHPNVS